MNSAAIEREAQQFLPGDLLSYDGKLYRCLRVAVSTETVEIEADRLVSGGTGDRAALRFAPAQLIRVPPAPADARERAPTLFPT